MVYLGMGVRGPGEGVRGPGEGVRGPGEGVRGVRGPGEGALHTSLIVSELFIVNILS